MPSTHLKLTGEVGGRVLEGVEVDLEEVWEKIDDADFAKEIAERANSEPVKHAIIQHVPDSAFEDEDREELFADWGDWDRRELLSAIRAGDARRTLELLKRHA